MHEVVLPAVGSVAAWRQAARQLARMGAPPGSVLWRVGPAGDGDLFAGGPVAAGEGREIKLPREAVAALETALHHKDRERFALAYGIVLRLTDGVLRWGDRSDPALRRLLAMEKAVRRDIHKMHAFVRFRELPAQGGRRRFAAWFEPEHNTVEPGTPFFANRFGDMDWLIATPTLTARFVSGALGFAETANRDSPPPDAAEDLWKTYYASIFNPARLMPKAMQSEMPKKYWRNLPEAELIPDLIRGAEARVRAMQAAPAPEPPARAAAWRRMAEREVPMPGTTMDALRTQAASCQRCALHACATQTVFGEGPEGAALMVVGEQPGDAEDLAGRPFVGPSGRLWDEEAALAGLDRGAAYVTNAVKHFKFQVRGKRRIHQSPDRDEIDACRWWLDLERRLIRPRLILTMGATALEAVTGSGSNLLKRRGTWERAEDGTPVLVTVHPSYILRLPEDAREAERARFRADLAAAAEAVARV